jgi:hypothetical protein
MYTKNQMKLIFDRYQFLENKQLSNSEYSLSCLHQVKSHLDEILVTVEYDNTTKREIMGII